MHEQQLKNKFQKIEDNFNTAVITNSVDEIKKCITSDWVLVDSQGGVIPQERFFSILLQGLLSHSTMTKEVLRVKVYGEIALVTGRGQNTGTWQGQPMEADEWITDVYKKEGEKWLCVLTHLTPVKNS
jgi:ketosteroid isomerase-like protein